MDLENHLANQCRKVPTEVKTTFLRILTQRFRDTNNTTSQSDIQTIVTTSTATIHTAQIQIQNLKSQITIKLYRAQIPNPKSQISLNNLGYTYKQNQIF